MKRNEMAEKWVEKNSMVLANKDYDIIVLYDELYDIPVKAKVRKKIKQLIESKFGLDVILTPGKIVLARDREAITWVEKHEAALQTAYEGRVLVFRDVPPELHACDAIKKEIMKKHNDLCVSAVEGAVAVFSA